jgi:hypothetical protein
MKEAVLIGLPYPEIDGLTGEKMIDGEVFLKKVFLKLKKQRGFLSSLKVQILFEASMVLD